MDNLRALAELARLDAPQECVCRFMLITAPSNDTLTQSDCDCACPATPSLPPSLLLLGEDARLQLHPQAAFLELKMPVAAQPPVADTIVDGSDPFLVFIPSVLSGAVVNRELRGRLLALREPRPRAVLSAELGSDLVERLVALGILVADGATVEQAASETLVAWLHVTNACNLRCTYCYLNKTEEPMDSATGRAAVDAIVRSARLHGYRAVKLKFAGGEASLNFPLVWELHAYAQEQTAGHGLSLEAVVLSNGVGLTRHELAKLKDRGIRLMISLDGFAADHDAQRVFANGRGSFRVVSRTIERALEVGLRPNISVTVSGQTAAGLAPLVAWLLERDLPFGLNFYRENDCSAGFAELQLDEQRIVDGMLAAFDTIEQRLPERSLLGSLVDRANLSVPHSKPCGVGESYLVIDQRGGVAKCQMEIERPITTVHAADPLGVVREDAIGVRNLPVEQREGCRDCTWRHWCAGGCSVATFRATGRYDVRSPNCGIYKALYPHAIRLEGLRILQHGAREWFGAAR